MTEQTKTLILNARQLNLLSGIYDDTNLVDLKEIKTMKALHDKIDVLLQKFIADREVAKEPFKTEYKDKDGNTHRALDESNTETLMQAQKAVESLSYEVTFNEDELILTQKALTYYPLKSKYSDGRNGIRGRDDVNAFVELCELFGIEETATEEKSQTLGTILTSEKSE